jgi:hypothetical protein
MAKEQNLVDIILDVIMTQLKAFGVLVIVKIQHL